MSVHQSFDCMTRTSYGGVTQPSSAMFAIENLLSLIKDSLLYAE